MELQPFTFNPAATAGGTPGNSGWFLGLGGTQGRNTGLGELHDTFGWTHGSHQFTFGGDATLFDANDFFDFNPSVGLGIDQYQRPSGKYVHDRRSDAWER